MKHDLVKLNESDGSWDVFCTQWRDSCTSYGEDFETYARDAMPVLIDLVRQPKEGAGVYALRSEQGSFDAACQANSTYLPGYTGKVLRVRHLLMSPHFDFGDYPIEDYSRVLARMFSRTIELAKSDLPSEHIKFHLRSPADRQFFEAMTEALQAGGMSNVALKGAWLYLTL